MPYRRDERPAITVTTARSRALRVYFLRGS